MASKSRSKSNRKSGSKRRFGSKRRSGSRRVKRGMAMNCMKCYCTSCKRPFHKFRGKKSKRRSSGTSKRGSSKRKTVLP